MRKAILPFTTLVIGVIIGFMVSEYIVEGDVSQESVNAAEEQREILYWVAPMDANFRRDKPGKSPMGMDLVPVYADRVDQSPDSLQIDPNVIQNLGVRSEDVQYGRLDRKIETVGYVEYDENALQHIHTRVDGWVEELTVKAEGDPVRKDETLFELYSRTLVNAQQEYLLAKSSLQDPLIVASQERLVSLGMTAPEILELDRSKIVNQRVKVIANTDGVVAMLGIREGVYVTPATHVMSIADLDRVWILAEVMERHADAIEIGQDVVFEVDSKPGRSFEGQVEYIYPDLDPRTRSLKVRIGYSVQDDVFRPNMFARVSIVVSGKNDVIHVPSSAVIRGGASDRVVLDLGDGRFRSVPVQVGYESGNFTEILRGLNVMDRVVTSGQFLIDSESNIDSALARFQDFDDNESLRENVGAEILGLNLSSGTLRVKHDRVPAWGWPAMTMDIEVADASLLQQVAIGDHVQLEIEKQSQGDVQITAIGGTIQ
ncbi:MAG: efflux RND transporter periplasmic adaptor subunit [Gammaproteobacteria bacterium]|nr:efflux RND transporter periplasmic adaptor subunit [Gammaproteobacteria bacterium]